MPSRVVMPKLTDTMEEGVVLKWKKREGEPVAAGDVLAEIETDKAVMDLEAFASGVLRKVLAAEGETVKAGALIGVIAEPEEDIEGVLKEGVPAVPHRPAPTTQEPARQRGAEETKAAGEQRPARAVRTGDGDEPERVKASPRARALAAERGVDLSTVRGTGPGGRIIEEDVLAALEQPSKPAAPQPPVRRPSGERPQPRSTDRPLSQMRKAIARITTESKAPVPHFYVTTDVDMAEAERLRHHITQTRRFTPSLNDLILKAAALALSRHPEINVSYTGEAIRWHASIDIGIAVGLEDGLIAPVLRDCGRKSLAQIAREAHELIERARSKRLQPPEYTGATFSVSNLGMYHVESFVAVLMPPEAAALAIGTVRDVPVVEEGQIRAGRRMTVTMSCDHRALDGVQAARFLQEFRRILEHPLELILEDPA